MCVGGGGGGNNNAVRVNRSSQKGERRKKRAVLVLVSREGSALAKSIVMYEIGPVVALMQTRAISL